MQSAPVDCWDQFESKASSGCLVSTLLIRRTEIVKGNDLGWFTLNIGHKWEQRQGPHYWQWCYNATFSLPKSQERPEEFWLSSQQWGKRCKKNKASAKSDLKANGAQDELFEIRSSRRHSPQTCVILDRCRESRDYCLQRLKRHKKKEKYKEIKFVRCVTTFYAFFLLAEWPVAMETTVTICMVINKFHSVIANEI